MTTSKAPAPTQELDLTPVVTPTEGGHFAVTLGDAHLAFATDGTSHKPLVRDLDLATWFGYGRPRDIRRLIHDMEKERKLKGVDWRALKARQSTGNGASREYTVTEAWLTREQALLVATQAKGDRAWSLTEAMVGVFDAVLTQMTASASAASTPPAAALPTPPPTLPAPTVHEGILEADAPRVTLHPVGPGRFAAEVGGASRLFSLHGGTLRLLDEDLGTLAGLAQGDKVRRTILRLEEKGLIGRVLRPTHPKGPPYRNAKGHPLSPLSVESWLTREEALLVAARCHEGRPGRVAELFDRVAEALNATAGKRRPVAHAEDQGASLVPETKAPRETPASKPETSSPRRHVATTSLAAPPPVVHLPLAPHPIFFTAPTTPGGVPPRLFGELPGWEEMLAVAKRIHPSLLEYTWERLRASPLPVPWFGYTPSFVAAFGRLLELHLPPSWRYLVEHCGLTVEELPNCPDWVFEQQDRPRAHALAEGQVAANSAEGRSSVCPALPTFERVGVSR
ncbi:MAG: hypothetical protein JNK72_24800 [Myxococcales bacterium]|nr:hypothetical protein [Myxococcales bacterium]